MNLQVSGLQNNFSSTKMYENLKNNSELRIRPVYIDLFYNLPLGDQIGLKNIDQANFYLYGDWWLDNNLSDAISHFDLLNDNFNKIQMIFQNKGVKINKSQKTRYIILLHIPQYDLDTNGHCFAGCNLMIVDSKSQKVVYDKTYSVKEFSISFENHKQLNNKFLEKLKEQLN